MEKKPHPFCETPEENCTMNYCDDNGCQNRKRELVNPYMGVVNGLTDMVHKTLQSGEIDQLKAENERLKSSLEQIRRCMVGWKSHLHPDLLTLKTIDKILIEHINH